MAGTGDTSRNEIWFQNIGPDRAIRVRTLSQLLERGASIIEARLTEGEDGLWGMTIRLSDRPGELQLNLYKSASPKRYKAVALAVGALRNEYRYRGPIILTTDII